MLTFGRAMRTRLTAKAKALQIQTQGATDGKIGGASESSFADSFVGGWAFYAPPAKPTVDPVGNVSGACELAVADFGDQQIVLGQRDVRWSKLTQDLADGESAQINAFGDRLVLREKIGSLAVGGGFLVFDKDKKSVGLSGIPSSAGAGAPYLSIDTSTIGLVSATGGSSIAAKADQVTLSGAGISLDAGSVSVGKGAVDPVVLQSLLLAVHVVIQAWANTHVHAALGAPPSVPLILPTTIGSLRVKAA